MRNNLIFELDGLDFLQSGTPVSFLDRLKVENGCISAQIDNIGLIGIGSKYWEQKACEPAVYH